MLMGKKENEQGFLTSLLYKTDDDGQFFQKGYGIVIVIFLDKKFPFVYFQYIALFLCLFLSLCFLFFSLAHITLPQIGTLYSMSVQ